MVENSHRSRAAIEAIQLEQLKSLIAELFPGNRFYSAKLNSLGLTFDVAGLTDFSTRFPFTTKAELAADQQANGPFGTNLTYPLQRYTRYHQTSGTSGTPLRWLDTPDSWDGMVESWAEILSVAGVKTGDRLYFAFSFGPFIGFWLAYEAGARLGCLCIPGGGLSSAARVQTILENEITVLCCTPTYAIRLAEVAAEEQIDLSRSRVRLILVAGEPGGSVSAVRAKVAGLWNGARVFDHHGMTEVGPVTYECPGRAGVLHVIETAYLAEVIDSTGASVPPGGTGELVLTTLQRVASPLLRYRTGDVVKRGPINSPCACGRSEMTLEGGILGRTDDMVVVRGVNVYPGAVESIVQECGGIAEYQVEISTAAPLPEMMLQIEPTPDTGDAAGLVRKLERSFESALALRVPITIVPFGTLPRSEMKARRWLKR